MTNRGNQGKAQEKSAAHGVRTGSDGTVTSGSRRAENRKTHIAGIPRWRLIEIMRERAQLREALGGFDLDFDELEEEVFGSDAEHEMFYRNADEFQEEAVSLDDEDFDDEEFDDFEDA